jgi:hypothetical protein
MPEREGPERDSPERDSPERDVPARLRVAGVVLLAILVAAGSAVPARAAAPRSKDDRGFSIALVSPSDPYLTGPQTLRIEAIIPRGDTIEEVDFFVDGRLQLVAQGEPYACDHDFGSDIRRHVVEVRALTHDGRRAKVSFVSRSVDVTEGASGAVATVAAVVRNPAGRPVAFLGASDFVLTEDGERRSIVHFAAGSSPASLALVIEARIRAEHPEAALASFLRELPEHQAVTFVSAADKPAAPDAQADAKSTAKPHAKPDAKPEAKAELKSESKTEPKTDTKTEPGADAKSAPVWLAPAALAASIQTGLPADGAASLMDDLGTAARLFDNRRDPRVLLLVITVAPPAVPEPAPPTGPPAAPTGPPAAAEKPSTPRKAAHAEEPPPVDPAKAEDDMLAAGLEAVLRARAAVYVVAVGPGEARVPPALREMAARSGGQFLLAPDLAAVPQALRALSEALRNRYLITFMPAEPGRAGWHALDIAVRQPDLAVQAPKTLAFP